MNTKINGLAKKAGIDEFGTTHQKFAELIVKETLSVVYDELHGMFGGIAAVDEVITGARERMETQSCQVPEEDIQRIRSLV